MSVAQISLEALASAFSLPPGEPPRRVPKATLAEHAPTASDRKLIESKLARLDWIAAINPATTGIAAGSADGLTIDTINLLAAQTRGPMPPRLAEIIHRAIPKPVVLIHRDVSGEAGAALSLAPKRAAEREADRVVTTALFDTGTLSELDRTFLKALSLPHLPTHDLAALYVGLIERTEAIAAARAFGRAFRLPKSQPELADWREALAAVTLHRAEIAGLTAAIRKECRLSIKVELGEKVRQTKIRLDELKDLLK